MAKRAVWIALHCTSVLSFRTTLYSNDFLHFYAEHILRENLTVIPQFHSHLEPMRNIGDLDKQITLSFSDDNTIGLDGPFSKQVDPTRYFSSTFYPG